MVVFFTAALVLNEAFVSFERSIYRITSPLIVRVYPKLH